MLVFSVTVLFGCGGGGGGSSNPGPPAPAAPAKATTTVTGKVSFPSLTSLVNKRVYDTAVTIIIVQAYTIDGVAVGSPVTAGADGSYSIPGLDSGIDYIIKATRGGQVLKKLIEKGAVTPGITVFNQDVSGVSTTAVVLASQKLDTNLGEPVTLTEEQKSKLSANISVVISPKDLESAISSAAATVQAAINGGTLSALNKDLANLFNTLNIIVAAICSNTDPAKATNGFTLVTDAKPLQLLNTSGAVVTSGAVYNNTDRVEQTVAAETVTTGVNAYKPPSRVQLEIDISSEIASGALYGTTFDITIPADAKVKLDEYGRIDLSALSLSPGVSLSCLSDASLKGNHLKITVVDGSTSLPSGKLVTFVFDKTPGKVLTIADFGVVLETASDSNGQKLLSGFKLTSTVTSSGS